MLHIIDKAACSVGILSLIASFAIQIAHANTTASVSANVGTLTGNVSQWSYGINTAVWDYELATDTALPSLLKNGGITAARFPGGSYSDDYHWSTNTGTPGFPISVDSANTFQNWMNDFAIPSGASPVITVNYGSNSAGTGGGDPNEAASWVQYANKTNNYGIKYWEIGNEVGGNGYYQYQDWELDLHYLDQTAADRIGQSVLSPAAYGQNALAYISAMKAVDSTIKCGVGISIPGQFPDTASPSYNQQLLSQCGSKIDFVIIHYYPNESTTAQYLAAPASIASIVSSTRAELNEYCGSNASNIQILITETGALDGDQSDAALFVSDDFLSWIENGIPNIDFEDLHQGYLAQGVSGTADDTQKAQYWGIKMATLAARVGDNMGQASSNNSLLRAHAVARYDGSAGIVLLNEDPNNADNVSLSVSGQTLSTSGTLYQFGPSHFNGSPFTTNGPTQSTISGVGNNFTITVPAYTEDVIIIPKGTGSGSIANGTYKIINRLSGLALDAYGYGTSNGTVVDQWTYGGGNNQRWIVTNEGSNQYKIENVNAQSENEVLDAAGYGGSGTWTDLWASSGGQNQLWVATSTGSGYFTLSPAYNTGLALDDYGASTSNYNTSTNAGRIDVYTSTGANNQQWSFQSP